ncbi:hypothetical protein QJS10_CPA01g02292 [Acorus calamus]|uniref:Galactose oxidase n=1 Tax=Acorus calamus TaxID=4465 RepID=A0AAV9FER9_ACOCL|nr:hypothetical protein QJS10_CPA01g02292 [Acorus calamus]
MHMQLMPNDRVIIFDRTDFGPSNLSLPSGQCRSDDNDTALKIDCTAHSAEYDVPSNSFRPLTILTDTWCSSASLDPDGRLVQTGGFNDGERAVRFFRACAPERTCDWEELPLALAARRWYATNQILPDGRAVIVGGRRQFNYEFYPKSSGAEGTYRLPFLREMMSASEDNLYPFVHLNVDGNLFIFANNRAILLDYTSNTVVKSFPRMPGEDPRNYPSSGSSVLMPLNGSSAAESEVLICGGARAGAYEEALKNKTYLRALSTCGRLRITDASPAWAMEEMPTARVMGDMVLMPNGKEVLIVNGAAEGTAGWELARSPVMAPVIYRFDNGGSSGSRFSVLGGSDVPRMYHSTAVLLRDGRVLVGGSNPHVNYNFYGVLFPTELSLEAFSPPYLDWSLCDLRPAIVESPQEVGHGRRFSVGFTVRDGSSLTVGGTVSVTVVAPGFATHALAMNQRVVVLDVVGTAAVKRRRGRKDSAEGAAYDVEVVAPANGKVAPAGYYMLFVVNGDVPSEGVWVRITNS